MCKRIVCSLVVLISFAGSSAPAQGPLAPAGAPGLTMKTLDQVEARTPINSIPITIGTPGSYYLAGSLSMTNATRGISIWSDDVTVDLNGFSLHGTNGTDGIYVGGTIFSNIVIRNGSIEGWKQYGVEANAADNLMVRDVQVRKTGAGGIRLGMNSIAENCQVMDSATGIRGYTACAVRQCQVMNIAGTGIELYNNALVENSQAIHCGTNGIYVGDDSIVRNCTVFSNQLDGISAGNRGAVLDNLCNYNAWDGTSAHIISRGNETRIERNQLGQTPGACIRALGSGNIIADNVVLDFRATSTYDLSKTNSISILIHKLPVFLDWPCKAQLAGSLSGADGIFIQADGVTLDLGGHTLTGNGVNPGITIQNAHYATVRNGILRNWNNGIYGPRSTNCTIENVKFIGNGTGADLGQAAQVSNCSFIDNFDLGLNCGQAALITECDAIHNTQNGYNIGMGSLINRCVARDNGSDGFSVGAGCDISGCVAMYNASNGIYGGQCLVRDNTCTLNRNGVFIIAEGARVENNLVAFNDNCGIWVAGINNIIMRNTARNNSGGNYNISAGNATGILVNVTGGGAISSSNPWVNFSF